MLAPSWCSWWFSFKSRSGLETPWTVFPSKPVWPGGQMGEKIHPALWN